MIRDRRDLDLDPLCRVLATLGQPPGCRSDRDRRAWLEEHDAEVSWVFDQAPVSVAPTGNVVAHLQILAPPTAENRLVEAVGLPSEDVLVIGKLFVGAVGHEDGIRRFLLREAVRVIRDRGAVPVLDLSANPGLSQSLCEKRGFVRVASAEPGTLPMVHRESRGTRSGVQ
ncbi:hypothetical protein [Ornithinimicrobium cavernae]|uniref:hypothetical protein n=1 Tax=Ornithinimicrobium cavernae TaxID=2666047 RepID=UPI0012B181E8|nr:hypothetical protein [Ornithinimicrobium cavernae]